MRPGCSGGTGSNPNLPRQATGASSRPSSDTGHDSEAGAAWPPSSPLPRRTGWRHTFRSLGNREFVRLWLGDLFMMAGFQMQIVAQGYLVYDLTSSAKILAPSSLLGATVFSNPHRSAGSEEFDPS